MVLFSTVLSFEPSKGFQYPSSLAVLSVLCPSRQVYCHARATQSCSTPLLPLWCVLAANQSVVWLCLQRMFLGVQVMQERIINRSCPPQGTWCWKVTAVTQLTQHSCMCVHDLCEELSLPRQCVHVICQLPIFTRCKRKPSQLCLK